MVNGIESFVELLRARKLFDGGSSVFVARAPGRLDVMGGIADYSGSLVLQRPIAEGTFVAVELLERPVIEVTSLGREPFALPLDALMRNGAPIAYPEARDIFSGREHHWASYVIGVVLVLLRECGVRFDAGMKIAIASAVPEGKGVGSSAALETATLKALATALNMKEDAQTQALLCQKAENLVAGAPCGVMDQMTCMCGEEDFLLALLCQPAQLQTPVRVPNDIALWGLDSGERHAVSGSDYTSVRTGAFMGHRMISAMCGGSLEYLANLSPTEFEREFLPHLPDEMRGEEFLRRHSATADTVTRVEPHRVYKVRQPAAHPIYEHHRVTLFRQLLLDAPSEERRRLLGELMYESHASYLACGLGSKGTDQIVSIARAEGPANGIYGARITGGGSGGTVAILGSAESGNSIARIGERYESITGYRPHVFRGSSPGAAQFGSYRVRI